MEPQKLRSETHSPAAEAQARAGEVLIWKEGVTAHLLVWYVSAKALAQGLKKGGRKETQRGGKDGHGSHFLARKLDKIRCWFMELTVATSRAL